MNPEDSVKPVGSNPLLGREPAVSEWSYFQECVGAKSYRPKCIGAHQGAHPKTVREILEAMDGTRTADVIVALIFKIAILENRCAFLSQTIQELYMDQPNLGVVHEP